MFIDFVDTGALNYDLESHEIPIDVPLDFEKKENEDGTPRKRRKSSNSIFLKSHPKPFQISQISDSKPVTESPTKNAKTKYIELEEVANIQKHQEENIKEMKHELELEKLRKKQEREELKQKEKEALKPERRNSKSGEKIEVFEETIIAESNPAGDIEFGDLTDLVLQDCNMIDQSKIDTIVNFISGNPIETKDEESSYESNILELLLGEVYFNTFLVRIIFEMNLSSRKWKKLRRTVVIK